MVDGLAEQEDGAAILYGLLTKQVDGEAERVQDGGAAVALVEVAQRLGGCADVVGERLFERRDGVEGHHGDLVRDVADQSLQRGGEAFVLVELVDRRCPYLGDDDEREPVCSVVGFEGELLLDAVVGEGEVVGGEGVDELAGLGFDEGGDEDEGGAGGEGVWLVVRRFVLAKRRSKGKQPKCDGEEEFSHTVSVEGASFTICRGRLDAQIFL